MTEADGAGMRGFDPHYADLPDYILKCTAMIWEGRGLSELDWHYGDDLLVRTPGGINRGNAAGITGTMSTLAEFPDRQLLGEDVIWCGDDRAGFLSSHRIMSTATHRGGAFGAATGKQVRFRTIADTFCKDNRVWDEWLIRDNSAIALQIGSDARQMAARFLASPVPQQPLTRETDVAGPYEGTGDASIWGALHASILNRLMSADFSAVQDHYDRACEIASPGGATAHGWGAADRLWLGLRSALPDAAFRIEHQMGRDDPLQPPRSAIRWSLTGTHSGWGRFGAPTGAQVHVMGVSHVEFGPNGLRREVTLFDEVAIWTQILMQTGDMGEPSAQGASAT